jgi:endonuclease/exonuclease/phosphatase family metal-dependent hydrolase
LPQGKSFFVKKTYGQQAYEDYAPEQLLQMGKAQMGRVLLAYENALPGSAAEKLRVRSDLEATLNQLECESLDKAIEELPKLTASVAQELQAFKRGLDGAQKTARQEQATENADKVLLAAHDHYGQTMDTEENDEADIEQTNVRQLEEKTSELARSLRQVQQGGAVPAHFVTLTTAIYHWPDLACILEQYEKSTTALRHGRMDPLEPGEDRVPLAKRRVCQYPGVVAWYCALKLELYSVYVLKYDDLFGVYEWGSGGIVHMHLLGWRKGMGRYDTEDGEVPVARRRREAMLLATRHNEDICEWNLLRPEHWDVTAEFDEDIAPERSQPLETDDEEHDSSHALSSSESEDDRDIAEKPLDELTRNLLDHLEVLLEDPHWHPASLPPAIKQIICGPGHHEKRVRVLRRRYLAKLLRKTNMHDRHNGPAVSTPAVYGDDEASSLSSDEETKLAEQFITPTENDVANLRIITLNADTSVTHLSDLLDEAAPDLCCLQEISQENHAWILENYADTYDIASPREVGVAFHSEHHDVAILWKKETFSTIGRRPWLTRMDSPMKRKTLTVRLAHRQTGLRITLATAHFDSGNSAELVDRDVASQPGDTWGDVRRRMLDDAMKALGQEAGDAVIFAGDFNLRDSEPRLLENWEDAWCLAGEPAEAKSTMVNEHDKRYDRLFFFSKEGATSSEDELQKTIFLPDTSSFKLLSAKDSDHWAVCCNFCVIAAYDRGQIEAPRGLGAPLYRGLRGRCGAHGVARRPSKHESCAKEEPHNKKGANGEQLFYCCKGFEKSRVRKHEEAILEDPRRPGLWRIMLSRNCPVINSYIVLLAITLGANTDAQPVLTTKGAICSC